MLLDDYMKEDVKNVRYKLKKSGQLLKNNFKVSMDIG